MAKTATKSKNTKSYYRVTKDGIYTPEGKYINVWWWWNDKNIKYGDSLHVHAADYAGDLGFLETATDKLTNNSEPMIDYFEKDYIKISKENPFYDLIMSGFLKKLNYDAVQKCKKELERAEELMKSLETHTPLAKDKVAHSIKLIEATKDYAVKRKNYEASLEAKKDTDKAVKMLEKKYKESLKN